MTRPVFVENIDHTTYRNKDGVIVPSVTTIIKMINKEALLYWSNNLGFKKKSVKKELEISAYIGTVTHQLIKEYTMDKVYSLDGVCRSGPVERILIKNAFKSFLQFYTKNKNILEYILAEESLSGKRFGGTLDALVKYDDNLTLTDYKTSKSFYPTMALQIAGYDILLRELLGIKVDQYMIILLDKKDGKEAKVKIINDKDEMKFYRTCFKKLLLFYYDWEAINQIYWKYI